jgi:hypothetical protein
MYGKSKGSTGRSGGGNGGFLLPQTGVKYRPIKNCPHGWPSSNGQCSGRH